MKEVIGAIILSFLLHMTSALKCMYPGHAVHSMTNMTGPVDPGTTVDYKCDPGFEMIGTDTRTCLKNGTWTGQEPRCAVNVARHRHVTKVPDYTVEDENNDKWEQGKKILDGFYATCSIAFNTDMLHSTWSIDLLQKQTISYMKIAFENPIKNIKFKVYYEDQKYSRLQLPVQEENYFNPHSVFVEMGHESKEITEYVLMLIKPIEVREISVEIPSQYGRNRISLCEVSVYSETAPSSELCQLPTHRDVHTAVLDSNCYSFHSDERARWNEAIGRCHKLNKGKDKVNGRLVSRVTEESQQFLRIMLQLLFTPPTQRDVFWVGGHRRSDFQDENVTPIRQWLNDTTKKYWHKTESKGITEALQSCLSISGPLGWLWTMTECNANHPWICQYDLPQCGSPDQSVISQLNFDGGAAIYSCPDGFVLEGEIKRNCLPSGVWSGHAPWCRYVNCGQPEGIFNGSVVLVSGSTTYGHVAEYSCAVPGHFLIGPSTRACERDGKWSGETPFCSDSLPDPEGLAAILNLEVVLAISLACLGIVVLVTVITLCVVFFKKRTRRMSSASVPETKTFLARFDSDGDLGPDEPIKNGALITAYGNSNGKA